MALERMLLVGLAVDDVVDEIDDTGEARRRSKNAAVARSTASPSNRRMPKSRPAKTMRFLVHCAGRRDQEQRPRRERGASSICGALGVGNVVRRMARHGAARAGTPVGA